MKHKTQKTKSATAYHEAGHAVAAIAFDYLAESDVITIVAKDDALGSVSHGPPLMQGCQNKRQLRELVKQMCIGLYSGLAAERLLEPCCPDSHGEDDEVQAWNLPREQGITPRGCQFVGDEVYDRYLERLKREAETFVKRHRCAIEALAESLLEKRTMTGAEAAAVVEPLLKQLR